YNLPSLKTSNILISDKLQTTGNPAAINGPNSIKEKPTRSSVRYKQKDQRNSEETSPRFVKFDTGETIRLRCRILRGPYLVMWNKLGLDYPLTIGTRRFSPDERIRIQYKAPDKWVLTIAEAKLTDSGVYTCTTSTSSAPSDQFQHPCSVASKDGMVAKAEYANTSCQEENSGSVHDNQSNKKGSNEYYVTVGKQMWIFAIGS
ncbi:immunoglobulin V-set domain protein, partial [Opisthorchis viverrini]